MNGWQVCPGCFLGSILCFYDIDVPSENGSILYDNARCLDVTLDRTGFADLDPLPANNTPGDFPEHHDLIRLDVRIDRSVRTDRQTFVLKLDGPFDFAVNIEVLNAAEGSLELQRFSNP